MTTAVRRARAGNLPAELTSFIGRRRELAEAKELLAASRLVTLTGTGGVGKTRLARRIATDHRRAFPGGVWQVELAELQEPALLAQAVASALGLRGRPGGWAVGTLSEHFADQQLLLLLDNCEHLLDACAVMTDALLASCQSLHVLATSRQPLGIVGERTLSVQPLSLPDADSPPPPAALTRYDAVSLFLERAAAEVPGFELTDDNYRAVAQLCHQVDGVPLALELAAIRLRALSAEQIVARLDDRYALLSRGSRIAPARQQTLRGLVDWSYELCSPLEKELWAYLSVFPGGFDLEAAEAVCVGTPLEGQVVDALADLLDKSLLTRHDEAGAVRYRMLEIIRQYGLDRLREAGGEVTARRRHRAWYAELAARAHSAWFGDDQLAWYQRIQRESSNIRAAMDLSGAVVDIEQVIEIQVLFADYSVAQGTVAETAHWLERALVRCVEPSATRARGLRVAGYVAALQGDEAAASASLEESQAISRRLGLLPELAWCSAVGGLMALNRGDLAGSLSLYGEGYALFAEAGETYGMIFTSGCSAVLAALLGDGEGAAGHHARFNELAGPGERWLRSYVHWAMGMQQYQAGDLDAAAGLEIESIALRRSLQDHLGVAMCLEVLAWVAARQDRAVEAARLMGCCRRSFELGGSSFDRVAFFSPEHEQRVEQVRSRLGDEGLEREIAAGRELDAAEAVRLLAPNDVPEQGRASTRREAFSPLTRREHDIALLVAQGLSNKEIAASLVIAQRTAEGHVEHILSKLGFRSRAQVAAWVTEQQQRDL
jgi:non-specific serine/threonine protein kinase